ncbi:malate dehydrogenase (quinone) [Planctomicrobium sp. SH664]|uniref:malate dehydrogenase (quinone) n=1 Tax=Planctomicrobium sp. SH664 TaxID=3448125 RepID=UPI003F5BE1D9
MSTLTPIQDPDVILVGSGIMSANLGALLKCLDSRLKIQVYEVTEQLAQESSHGWNNAGTGHAGICELSYTPTQRPDGSVPVEKAVEIFEQFEYSKQFWAYAVASGMVDSPREFINPLPHLSFVHGEKQVAFLRARYEGMSAHHFFKEMEYSTDRSTIEKWAPLLVEHRHKDVPIAATRMDGGTDINFGALARKLLQWLSQQPGCGIATGQRVIDLQKTPAGWQVSTRDQRTGEVRKNRARFVFLGAGGGSLPLLQKAGIPEAKGLGCFPIGGQWLVCDNPEVIARHHAKVYGQALDAAPTMAVPHLDTRFLDGRKTLLFGPFAAWTTKFLHGKGSRLDLFRSFKPDNIATLVKIGIHNIPLVRYLVQQGTQSMQDRLDVLHIFYPGAQLADWKLVDAGIRVQAIKKTDGQAGIVHYGTEVITDADRTLSALLGASPGASVSVHIVLEVVKKCFPQLLNSPEGKNRLKEMLPLHGADLMNPANAERYRELSSRAEEVLQLHPA